MNLDKAKIRTLRVLEVVEHAPLLVSLYVERIFDAEPGQFVNVWLPGLDEKPFSISDLTATRMELSAKGIGTFSKKLVAVKPGEWIGIRGPFGNGFSLQDDGLLVGGGTGVAPLRFLAHRLSERGFTYRTAVGVRTRSDLFFATDYDAADVMSDDGSIGGKGLVTARVEQLLQEKRPRMLYVAGPEPMLLAVRALAERLDVPYELSLERYMKCGFGLCGQCSLDGAGHRVCTEGPIFGRGALEGVTELGLPHRIASGRRP